MKYHDKSHKELEKYLKKKYNLKKLEIWGQFEFHKNSHVFSKYSFSGIPGFYPRIYQNIKEKKDFFLLHVKCEIALREHLNLKTDKCSFKKELMEKYLHKKDIFTDCDCPIINKTCCGKK